MGAAKAFEGFTREAPLTLKRITTPKLLDVPIYPLIGCVAQVHPTPMYPYLYPLVTSLLQEWNLCPKVSLYS